MANRNQDTYQPGQSRSRREDWRDEEYSRGARTGSGGSRPSEDDRGGNYGSYGRYDENDEGDSSVRAGSYDQGRRYGRDQDSREQSGSTGRYAGYGNFGQGNYGGGRSGWSGQDRYGQSGYGQGHYGQGDSGYQGGRFGSQRGQSGYGGQYGSPGGWNEPYGEGQQYSPSGDYGGGSSPGYGYGDQGYGNQGWSSRSQRFGQQGQHQGKGPKGYQRSDERIKELLCERLREDPEIDPSEVTITVQGGKITLEGTVDSRQTKHAIEEAADQFGAADVQNNLRVQRGGQQGSETQGKQGKGGASGEDNTTGRQKQH
jgi:hypothetical protein